MRLKKLWSSLKVFADYVIFYGRILLAPGLIITAMHAGIIFSIKSLCPAMPDYIPDFWVLLPLIGIGIYILLHIWKGGKAMVAHCKYNYIFPFWFCYCDDPGRDDRIDCCEICSRIREGDVILRKYRFYVDEFIFSANSYFTHVGIYDGEGMVLHSTSLGNVHTTKLNDFCNGKDIVVLRFAFSKSPEEEKVYGYITDPDWYENEEERKNDEALLGREEKIFTALMQNAKPGCVPSVKEDASIMPEPHPQISVVIDRARSLIGKLYDLKFDFKDFKKFSCIEYVWYCFKCFFPLHRIRVKDFEFFEFQLIPIIDPDVFIRNDFFHLIYSSVKNAGTKTELIDKIKKRRWTLAYFLLAVFLWDAVPMTALCYYYCYYS